MCNIVLNDNLSIRLYFEKVLELVKSGEDFPVNLDDVWPLIYSDKGKAVRVLTGDNGFIKDIDYKVFTQNGKNPVGGRPTIVYMISVSCMEYLIARKERRVFDVYRSVFHGAVNAFFSLSYLIRLIHLIKFLYPIFFNCSSVAFSFGNFPCHLPGTTTSRPSGEVVSLPHSLHSPMPLYGCSSLAYSNLSTIYSFVNIQ